MLIFDEIAARWKAETRAPGARQIVLWEQAQDNGLTEEERAELDRITMFLRERFRQFLQDARLC